MNVNSPSLGPLVNLTVAFAFSEQAPHEDVEQRVLSDFGAQLRCQSLIRYDLREVSFVAPLDRAHFQLVSNLLRGQARIIGERYNVVLPILDGLGKHDTILPRNA